jgi:hypothetical protein
MYCGYNKIYYLIRSYCGISLRYVPILQKNSTQICVHQLVTLKRVYITFSMLIWSAGAALAKIASDRGVLLIF